MKPTTIMREKTLGASALLTLVASLASAQVPFTEVADTGDLGSDFRYNWGASWGDFDKDGDMDLYVANGLQHGNGIFRNNGDLTFTRMTVAEIGDLGNDVGDTTIGIWGDIDNDGDLDMFVANYSLALTVADWNNFDLPPQADRLYLNQGDGTFALQADTLFGPPDEFSGGASLADFDGDSFLDILVTTYPLDASIANPKGRDILYRNDGSLGFSRVGGITVQTVCVGGSWFDYDGDGDLDALIPNEANGARSWIYKNQKEETGIASFTPLSQLANGVILGAASGAACGDYDNDGDLDFVLYLWNRGADLYTNTGEGNYTRASLLRDSIEGALAGVWFDYDNDGDLDLILSSLTLNGSWSDDACLLLENLGNGSFSEHVFLPRPPSGVRHRTAALTDVNNDGFIDVFIPFVTRAGVTGSPSQERDRLYTNNGNGNHWLKFSLRGTHSNCSAVGAIVRILANIGGNDVWQMRQVSAGGSGFAQHDPRLNFGMGDATQADLVRIEWPSGGVQELMNVAADQILEITEPPQLDWTNPGTISWPAAAHDFQLESAPSVDGPWTDAAETVEVNGTRRIAQIEFGGRSKFYRLRKP